MGVFDVGFEWNVSQFERLFKKETTMYSLLPPEALAGAVTMVTCLVTILATFVGWMMATRN